MRVVCCECLKIMDEGKGPDDIVSRSLCNMCYQIAMAEIKFWEKKWASEAAPAHD